MKGYRTVLANLVMGLPLLVEMFLQVFVSPQFGAIIPAEWLPRYALAVVVANLILRAVTSTPLGKK